MTFFITQSKQNWHHKWFNILRFSIIVISPSDDRSSDDCSVGIGTCAIVRGFMGCRIFPLEIEVESNNFEDEGKESVKFRRSWSKEREKKRENDMRYQKKKK